MTASYILTAVLISGVITWLLRAVPFAVLAKLRRSAFIEYMRTHMPLGVMMILALYAVSAIPLVSRYIFASIGALVLTIGLHLWRRSLALSVFVGTAAHVGLLSLL